MKKLALALCLFASPAVAQDFPSRAQDIVVTLYQQHKDLASGDDDQRRSLTKLMAEQIRFELGPEWGTKSAGTGRPQSKDSIARLTNGHLFGCDWQNGGTKEPFGTISCPELPGQIFIPVDPVNHLTQAPPVVALPPPVVVGPPPLSGVDFAAEFARLHAELADVRAAVDNPGWWRKALTNRYVQIVGAALVTWATVKK